ncbi:hypothetical protein RSSM_04352 [Rhodopirellula sallentina SM41]|uniref:Uncharacterized protein n=1 Tax=Rhodopirellula sallentina SM41 TaxID=1263870 RepID=M5TYE1_9BACT|nr:hypothetical protein RSSM_04352 [Rhodopirellula sallentina SM41]
MCKQSRGEADDVEDANFRQLLNLFCFRGKVWGQHDAARSFHAIISNIRYAFSLESQYPIVRARYCVRQVSHLIMVGRIVDPHSELLNAAQPSLHSWESSCTRRH